MKTYFPRILAITLSLVLLYPSCSSEFEPSVDDRIVPFFERFATEGAIRGVAFDNEEEQIEAYVQNISALIGSDVLGYCSPTSVRNPIRTVYFHEDYWNTATDLQREYLVFHELGHCFLDREHPDPAPADSLGNCLSMMSAGTAFCNGIDAYSADNREALLDELFSN